MAIVVSLRAVVDEMELFGDETRSFLNRQTGELYSTTTELLSRVEESDGDDEDEDFLDWDLEIVGKLREILVSPDWRIRSRAANALNPNRPDQPRGELP